MVLSEKLRSESYPKAPNELSPQLEEATKLYDHQQILKEQEKGQVQARSQDSGINLAYQDFDSQKNIIER